MIPAYLMRRRIARVSQTDFVNLVRAVVGLDAIPNTEEPPESGVVTYSLGTLGVPGCRHVNGRKDRFPNDLGLY